MKTENKINSALWFHTQDGKIKNVINYYLTIFETNFEFDATISLGETPSGYAEMCSVRLFGFPYLFMTTTIEHHKFNDSYAIMIHCENQNEIDKFWNYFTFEGKESQCGWCQDKFGLRWQIIPKNLSELMSKSNAWKIMSKQTKIIISEF